MFTRFCEWLWFLIELIELKAKTLQFPVCIQCKICYSGTGTSGTARLKSTLYTESTIPAHLRSSTCNQHFTIWYCNTPWILCHLVLDHRTLDIVPFGIGSHRRGYCTALVLDHTTLDILPFGIGSHNRGYRPAYGRVSPRASTCNREG